MLTILYRDTKEDKNTQSFSGKIGGFFKKKPKTPKPEKPKPVKEEKVKAPKEEKVKTPKEEKPKPAKKRG